EGSQGSRIRWHNGERETWGVVTECENSGKSILGRFDDGQELRFAWPSETVHHILLNAGQPVQLTATGDRGVVTTRLPSNGRIFYSVSLSDGGNRTVTEDGVRIAVETDPIARLRAGELDGARSVNLRLAATRL